MAKQMKEPQTGKRVWWVDICPQHESEPSPFNSLVEPSCTNCIYSENVDKHECGVAKETYCRYPNITRNTNKEH